MKKFTGTFASFALVTALATPAFAQDPQPTPQQAQPAPRDAQPVPLDEPAKPATTADAATPAEENSVTGELVKVDTDEMAITIKAADDKEHTFRYADSTKVVGAEGQVSGLATKAGQLVTVEFTQGAGDARIATKVTFDKK